MLVVNESLQWPTGTKDEINKVTNDFKEELLVVHAVFGLGMNAIIDVFCNSKSHDQLFYRANRQPKFLLV